MDFSTQQNNANNTDLFGNPIQSNDAPQQEESDWANMDAFGNSGPAQQQQLPNDFARLPMEVVV